MAPEMAQKKLFCIILIIWHSYSSFGQEEKLKLLIFYESLCPESVQFISLQLYPVWPKISQYIDVDFVPFGKSASLPSFGTFICQHGSRECYLNMLQSCTLAYIVDQNEQMNFVACFMKEVYFNDNNGEKCIFKYNSKEINNKIVNCISSQEGINLQLLAEKKTAFYNPRIVPTVIYGDVFSQEAQSASLLNFEKYVCTRIRHSVSEDACSWLYSS